jgi:predicted metal-dependent hydrolase
MTGDEQTGIDQDIEFKVVYSGRRTLGITILPDSTVIVRVPYLTSRKTINRIVQQKAGWITRHRENYRKTKHLRQSELNINGEIHLFRGRKVIMKIEKSSKPYVRFTADNIELGLRNPDDAMAVKRLLYRGYKKEAMIVIPEIISNVLIKFESQQFNPGGIIFRKMKRRWGSCSTKGIITLSTELIKLADIYIEYIILHELCHLKHHNHSVKFYKLLSQLCPDWKSIRDELRKHVTH